MSSKYIDVMPEDNSGKQILAVVMTIIFLICCGVGGCLKYGPEYHVWSAQKAGEAELAQAESNRKIAVLEAKAKLDAAESLASAEIARAHGVAEANKIIGEGLKGHEEYLRYLWLMSLEHVAASPNGSTVIYVPTEANLPILEATRKQ
jgi:regulator of protease activity HflC (stomatin/prohibitin superfamily)